MWKDKEKQNNMESCLKFSDFLLIVSIGEWLWFFDLPLVLNFWFYFF